MNQIKSQGVYASGLSLGVMLCESTYPGFPGDVKNPSGYPFSMQYDVVEDMRWETLVYGTKEEQNACLDAIVRSAKRLEKLGCKALVAECGYFIFLQEEIVKHVNIPVFMSSLLQIPFIQNSLPPDRSIGIVCASRKTLEDRIDVLDQLGLSKQRTIRIYGVADDHPCPQFQSLWDREDSDLTAEANFQQAEDDMIHLCTEFCEKYPDIGTLLFECTGFQPFANGVQNKLRLPIYSWGTLMEHIHSAVVHRRYDGFI